MKRYLLVGYFGFGNLGDEECLKITRDFLKNECNGMTRVLSRRGLSECGKEYSRARFRDIINAIRCSDAVILCGGNLLQNETSNKSLMFYCEIIRLAAMLRRKIYAISSGFGEIRGGIEATYAGATIQRLNFVGGRSGWDTLRFINHGARKCSYMPDLSFLMSDGKTESEKTHFALILTNRTTISETEIKSIADRCGLAPLIFVFFGSDDLVYARFLSRKLGAKIIKPKSYSEFRAAISSCAFSISERLHGAIFSFIAHTPTYISIHSAKCRAFIGEIASRGGGHLVMPYHSAKSTKIKEVEAQDSDFLDIIKSLREELYTQMRGLFL